MGRLKFTLFFVVSILLFHLKKREMRLHEWYKCSSCKEFHSVELDRFLKTTIEDLVKDENNLGAVERLVELLNADNTSDFREACRVLQTEIETLYTTTEFRRAEDAQLTKVVGRLLEVAFHVLSRWKLANFIPRTPQQPVQAVQIWGPTICVCAVEKLCNVDLTTTSLMNKPDWKIFCDILHNWHQTIQLFKQETDHWMELTDIKMHVKPIWFDQNRVYQFPVKVTSFYDSEGNANQLILKYELKINLGASFLTVASGEFLCHLDMRHSKLETMQQTKFRVFEFQTEKFENTTSVLRLAFYESSNTPRVWLRVPMVTHKKHPETTPDFFPIHSGGPKFVEKLKLKAVRRVALIDEQMKEENEQILERLQRLL